MNRARIAVAAGLVLGCSAMSLALAETPRPDSPAAKQEAERLAALPPVAPKGKPAIDPSGRKERGRASFYAPKFAGRTMADGRKMNPNHNVAASKALPLGTTARVTNLETDKSSVVVVKDRGPYVGGRIIDVTPSTADQLGMKKDGVVPVEVQPLKLPPKHGKSE